MSIREKTTPGRVEKSSAGGEGRSASGKAAKPACGTAGKPACGTAGKPACGTAGKTASRSVGTPASGKVVVYSALPRDHVFFLADGTSVRLHGRTVSSLVGAGGQPLPSGRYGVTPLDAGLWERIRTEHADSVLLGPNSNLIFVEADRERGDARAREQDEVRSGFEPVSPGATRSRPAQTGGASGDGE